MNRKKTLIVVILIIATFISIVIYSIHQYATINIITSTSDNAYHDIVNNNNNNIFAAHRVNSKEKILNLKDANITNIEIDAFISSAGTLLVGHDEQTPSDFTLLEYFDFINQEIPNFSFIWLDLKDLNKENFNLIYDELSAIDKKYNIKNRVLIESRHPDALYYFANTGWRTGYYLRYDLKNQSDEYYNEVIADIQKYNLTGITFDCGHTELAFSKFRTVKINNNKLELNCWDMTQIFLNQRYQKNFHDLNTILLNVQTNSDLK